MCLIDDAQWVDEASAQVLGFVARRLLAESVVLLLAVRDDDGQELFGDLPTLSLEGLPYDDAKALFTATTRRPASTRRFGTESWRKRAGIHWLCSNCPA